MSDEWPLHHERTRGGNLAIGYAEQHDGGALARCTATERATHVEPCAIQRRCERLSHAAAADDVAAPRQRIGDLCYRIGRLCRHVPGRAPLVAVVVSCERSNIARLFDAF